MRRLQHARQRALISALTKHLGDEVRIEGAASGLHLVAWFPALRAKAEPALVKAARERGVRVYPISPLFHPSASGDLGSRPGGLVMGYALLQLKDIEAGVARLAAVVSSIRERGSRTRRTV